MADKIRHTLEKFIPDLLALQKRRVFSETEVRDILHKREDFEYILQRRTHNLSNYMQLLEYEYGLERLRRERNKQLKIKKVTTRDYAIVKRIIYIWDRIMNKYRYNIDLWKQYLSFCYLISSKKQFFKVVTKAISFNPYSTEIWLAGALYELEKAHNPIKARHIFYQALRINNKNVDLWSSYLDFELQQLTTGEETSVQKADGFLPLDTVEPIKITKLKKLDGIREIIKLALENCEHSQIRIQIKKTLLKHNQNELCEEIFQSDQLETQEQIAQYLRDFQNDPELFEKLNEQQIDYSDELIKILKERNTFDSFWELAFKQKHLQNILLEQVQSKSVLFKLQLCKKGLIPQNQINFDEISKIKNKTELLEALLILVHFNKSLAFNLAKQNLLGQTQLLQKFLDTYYPLIKKTEQQELLNWLADKKQFCPLKYHKLRQLDFVQLIKLTEYHPCEETWRFVLDYTKQNFPQKTTQVLTSIQFLEPSLKYCLLK